MIYFMPKPSPQDQNTIKKCSHCKKVRDCNFVCQYCKAVFYCSIHCKQQDYKSSHIYYCSNVPVMMKNIQKYPKKGRVGLENIGNTCYLNSCIQCLSHTTELSTYFLNKYYKDQINLENILGLKGQLANAYYTCIYNLWAQNKQTYRPDVLRRMISRKNQQFATFQQHDASQLFATVIDGIHEDLNRSKSRISKTMPDIYGKSDQDGAKISWLHFLLNNQSIIVDTMTGLFKSVITCPTCSHVSIKFDTFNMINLPIPEVNEIKRLKFYVMYFQKPIIKCEIEFQEINFQKFKIQAARAIKRNHKDFKLFFLSQKRQIYNVENLKIQEFHKLFPLDKVYLLELTPEQRQLTNKFQLTCSFCTRVQGKFYNLWLKRPFFIDMSSETGLSFSKIILRFLYIFCFKDSLKKNIFGVQGVQYQEYIKQMLSSPNRPIKLIIIKTRKRVNNDYILADVGYEKQLKMVTDQYLISECIEYVLKNDQIQNNFEGPETPFNKKFQMIIEINQQAQKLFDFKKLIYQEQTGQQKKQKNQINIYRCFDAFDCEENLTAEWYCEWCQTKKKINKRMNIYRSPDILVIVLNRFKVVENGTRTKNDKQVNFPIELDLDKYVLDHKPMNSWIKIAKKHIDYKKPSYNFQPNLHISQKFDLYAVVNHQGSLNFGHYYAYAKNQGKWYKFDDSKVTEIHEMKQKYAYILFYRRKKQ